MTHVETWIATLAGTTIIVAAVCAAVGLVYGGARLFAKAFGEDWSTFDGGERAAVCMLVFVCLVMVMAAIVGIVKLGYGVARVVGWL